MAAVILLTAPAAHAANWVMVVGAEEGRPDALTPFGFAQALAEANPWSEPVTGLQAPGLQAFNGKHIAAEITEPVLLSARRARLGMRGSIPGTDKRVGLFFAVEGGQNALTRDRGLVLVDASLTLNVIPGARLRIGQFKLPTADEAIESNPHVAPFTRFSPFITNLLLEQDVVEGAVVGPAEAFRDIGAQAFDAFRFGAFELGYAAMVSAGRPIHAFANPQAFWEHTRELVGPSAPDATGRLQLSWLLSPPATWDKPTRDEVSVWAWRQQGMRIIDLDGPGGVAPPEPPASRLRQGVGGMVRLGGVRTRLELVAAEGVLLVPAAFAGQPARIDPVGRAHGGSLDLQVAQLGAIDLHPLVFDVSLDWLVRNPEDAAASRALRAVTFGTQVILSPNFRLLLNAEFRRQLVGKEAPADAARIAAGLSPVLSAQLNMVF